MATEMNANAIICEVMEENGISPSDIPEERTFDLERFIRSLRHRKKWSKRYYKGRAKGEFKCGDDECANTWTSPHSWCIVDLREQTILMTFKQKCIKVKERHVKADPDYEGEDPTYIDENSVRRMVQWAVNLHLYMIGKLLEKPKQELPDDHAHTAKHPPHLCQMCKLLKRRCNGTMAL